jgi:hypothetical protein
MSGMLHLTSLAIWDVSTRTPSASKRLPLTTDFADDRRQ